MPDSFCNLNSNQQQQQQSGIPSFSVQIVQQFTSSNTSQAPHSQTIQTNVTVQALSGGGAIKTSNSPLAPQAVSSPGCANAAGGDDVKNASISVGTNVECKREPDSDYSQCSVNGSRALHDLNGDLSNAGNAGNANNNITTTTSSTAATTGDRFSDSLANLGFPEDSNDDVIHPDILKDIIDDVFTNPSDLMNGFSFVDNISMKDNGAHDDKDSLRGMMSLGKSLQQSSSPPNHYQNASGSPVMSQFSMSQSQQTVFDFQTATSNSQGVANANSSSMQQQAFTTANNRMGSYNPTSPNLPGMANNGLGLDFKLTEPSPAAQTLKQMAEQHQNMQQKQQQQLGLNINASHPRSPFGSDSFPDSLSTMRSNFLNGSPNSMSSLQKSPTALFQPMSFAAAQQQQSFASSGGSVVKQEVITPAGPSPMYSPNMNQHMSDMELHKRRLQLQQQQQQQMSNASRPPYSHSPDQKPTMGISVPSAYSGGTATRPLSHYNNPSPSANHSSASNSPIPHHPGQFIRGGPTPGVTPPPPPQSFRSSPSPSAGTLHLSQSQQLQLSSNNQQLQVSQSQQQLIMAQDMKPSISAQQQQHVQSRGYYPGQTSVHMSQSQSVSFQYAGANARSSSPNTTPQQQRTHASSAQANPGGAAPAARQQQHMQQYMGRPPPEYHQTAMEPRSASNSPMSSGSHQPSPSSDASLGLHMGQRGRTDNSRKPVSQASYPQSSQQEQVVYSHSLMMPGSNAAPTYTSGKTRGVPKQSGNVRTGASAGGKQCGALPRHQRPPNVNIGPEGLNISQRGPAINSDWRHVFVQRQPPQVISNINPMRMSYPRATSYRQSVSPANGGSGNFQQVLQGNPNSPANGAMLSNSPMGEQTLAMHNINSSSSNHLLMQQQQVLMSNSNSNNSMLNASQLQMSMPIHNALHQSHQQVFSSPPQQQLLSNSSSQGMVPDGSQFNLDFLDNLDCSTSDLLNFDVSSSTSFPLLEDMGGMLDK